jgi:hypothetical protein
LRLGTRLDGFDQLAQGGLHVFLDELGHFSRLARVEKFGHAAEVLAHALEDGRRDE